MKRSLTIMTLSLAALGLTYACGTETQNLGNINQGLGGTPGLATGRLLDENGDPIFGASVYTHAHSHTAFTAFGGQLAHTEFDICPTPVEEVEHGGCTDENGGYELDCEGEGNFTIHVLNNEGTELPEITGVCGGFEQEHDLAVGPQPTPTPTATPTPTPTSTPN